MEAQFAGKIKPNEKNNSWYWYVTVPVYSKKIGKTVEVEFIFDSGAGRGVSFSAENFSFLGKNVRMLGADLEAGQGQGKYSDLNVIGLQFLQLTNSAIIKQMGKRLDFKLVKSPNLIRPTECLYADKIDGFKQGRTYLKGMKIKFSQNSLPETKTVIFDTAAGYDYILQDQSLYYENKTPGHQFALIQIINKKLSLNYQFTAIPQGQGLVGSRVFGKREIVFQGLNPNEMVYWIGMNES